MLVDAEVGEGRSGRIVQPLRIARGEPQTSGKSHARVGACEQD